MSRRLRILTWHVHGNYLYNLTQVPHEWYLVTDAERSAHRSGRGGSLPWGDNVHEAPVDRLHEMPFDVLLFQSRSEWEGDRQQLLSEAQRRLPCIYLEHDPPQEHPTATKHWVNDPEVLLVHVTPFNALMWDSGASPVRVIEHGVKLLVPARYTGERECGIAVVNNMARRGRRLGLDIYRDMVGEVPLSLAGMGSEELQADRRLVARSGEGATDRRSASRGEIFGEVSQLRLPGLMAEHRFFFNPIRYTSLGLAVIEAMLVGLPIVGLATTELVTVIRNGENGFIDTRPDRLATAMKQLLADPGQARSMGEAARRTAEERFGIERFVADWLAALDSIVA
ncbi:MAG: glycosyltransferase family 4 protein [Methylibium sp.]|nr:glycosyltransferase family 4 protein [Methylibium sp.]